ncbi:bifunctional polysaccharide deacetylase/glycosyltransferase family 2 protein [Rhizomonospora bruguierae]|uniref:bifunctional polysaccharide deacetylase/glycosyltransferase family 2 protein n=1 Tax=Rhizomonospora bruguierae TaxID=1581705 RepID=UPI0020C12D82|nr:bifunctional polysaccharide deacetylase/glycosyltransferase family 2 protein [Micromonospora sp. NBRC 107566]
MSTAMLPAPPGQPGTPPKLRRRVLPRPRTVVIALLLLAFASPLAVAAYTNSQLTPDMVHEVGDQDRVPEAVHDGGPIINATGQQPRSYRLPPKTIALTFDDGPDPSWTPRVLDVLRRQGVKGTFFVIGSHVVRHPALARAVVAGGHELGLHTFTHPDLSTLPAWRRRMEYSQTQMAIANAAGVKASLLRFPYSSEAQAVDNADWPVLRQAGGLGYLVVMEDTDSQDWSRPGVDAILRNMTPPDDRGAIILMHDAGGDRSQTVAALDRFIPAMKARGYRFTTVTEGLNLALSPGGGATARQPVAENPAASPAERRRGASLVQAVRLADATILVLKVLFLVVGLLTIARSLLLLVLAGHHARRRRAPDWSWGPPVTAPVSVIVPAYNEHKGIAPAVRSLAGGDHPEIEVIVVDDGSTDGTAEIVEGLDLPNVRLLRQHNGGKAHALNAGLAAARHDLIVMVDADTQVAADSIRTLVQPMADPAVGAVAGNVKVGNRRSLIARFQHIEYVIGFNLDRRLYEVLRCMPTVPGALGAFRRGALAGVGGMSDDTLAEDTDVTMALGRAGWKVVYEEQAYAWTEAPVALEQLWRQRYRWSYGTMQAMWKHRRALWERGASGRFGRRGLPLLAVYGVLLPLLGPVIDLMAVYGLLFFGWGPAAGAWLAMLAVQLLTALVAFRLDREPLRPLLVMPLQQFAYRQVMYLVLVQSALTALTGVRLRWQKLLRTGDATLPPQPGRDAGREVPAKVDAEAGSGVSQEVSRT